ncbi:UPF0764 protein C16orf89 homolog [Lineus longissimus]|uniref:UPF0764 protein C16orf89 homolog n=1 Tax=Lineus longissimus TaxID=88925 RepID=UPI002B4EDB81
MNIATWSCLLLTLLAARSSSGETKTDVLLVKTLDALDHVLEYLMDQHRNINLDAVIGTRMVEATFSNLIHHLETAPKFLRKSTVKNALKRITALRKKAEDVSEKSLPYIKKDTPDYYHLISPILQKDFWNMDYPSRDLDPDLVVPVIYNKEIMRENDSDICISEYFGTGSSSRKCDISEQCWKLMTSPGYKLYSLSHEHFYIQIGIQYGCSNKMKIMRLLNNQPSLERLKAIYCSNMLEEARGLAADDFPPIKRDLFMEQAALCGMIGYRQFFNSEWLEAILSWQKPNGCYGFAGDRSDNLQTLQKISETQSRRHKRYEKPLEHQCLSHRSTVAAAALGQYVRYILEQIYRTSMSS